MFFFLRMNQSKSNITFYQKKKSFLFWMWVLVDQNEPDIKFYLVGGHEITLGRSSMFRNCFFSANSFVSLI